MALNRLASLGPEPLKTALRGKETKMKERKAYTTQEKIEYYLAKINQMQRRLQQLYVTRAVELENRRGEIIEEPQAFTKAELKEIFRQLRDEELIEKIGPGNGPNGEWIHENPYKRNKKARR